MSEQSWGRGLISKGHGAVACIQLIWIWWQDCGEFSIVLLKSGGFQGKLQFDRNVLWKETSIWLVFSFLLFLHRRDKDPEQLLATTRHLEHKVREKKAFIFKTSIRSVMFKTNSNSPKIQLLKIWAFAPFFKIKPSTGFTVCSGRQKASQRMIEVMTGWGGGRVGGPQFTVHVGPCI